MKIVYIHGFLSSPNSQKGQILKSFLENSEDEFLAPNFPDTPQEAYDCLDAYFANLYNLNDDIAIVGSSMGGFFATAMQVKYGFKIAVFNPCVHPQDYLPTLVGPQYNPYTKNSFIIDESMLDFLAKIDEHNKNFDADKTFVFLQDQDETLDYTKALYFYQGAKIKLVKGGCHAYDNFKDELALVMKFFKAK